MKKSLLLFFSLGFLLFIPHAHAAITFDSSSTLGVTLATTSNPTIVVGTGSNELLVANIGGACNVQSVTLGGVSATQTTSTFVSNRTSIWYATGFASGTVNATVTCLTAQNYGIQLSSFFGVNQSTPVDAIASSTSGNNTTPSDTITTTVANDLIINSVGWQDFGTTHTNLPNIGQTQIATSSFGGTCTSCKGAYASYNLVTSTQSYTMNWTSSQAAWVSIITAFRPVVASNPTGTKEMAWVGIIKLIGKLFIL